jgi:citrate/tricarballylate utilization protein
MPFDDLFDEAARQLNVCNACRYCAGYCPVWPALELRRELTNGDITHLANLCHDCRDCFTACMYTEPHVFAINPPKIFAEVREETYDKYVWPQQVPKWLRGRLGLVIGSLLVLGVLLLLVAVTNGPGALTKAGDGSPYEVISHVVLIAAAGAPALWAVGVTLRAMLLYWRDTHGPLRDLANLRAWALTLSQVARLSHQTGGAEGCSYENNQPSGARRIHHQLVLFGFLLTFLATVSAGFMENLLGDLPPYGYVSLPVLSGTVGGIMTIAGCLGLLRLKPLADARQTTATMRAADVALLWALIALNVTGLGVLVVRTTSLFGPVLVVHLVTVLVAFAIAPYTKFVHWVYRMLAMVKDNLEHGRPAPSSHRR